MKKLRIYNSQNDALSHEDEQGIGDVVYIRDEDKWYHLKDTSNHHIPFKVVKITRKWAKHLMDKYKMDEARAPALARDQRHAQKQARHAMNYSSGSITCGANGRIVVSGINEDIADDSEPEPVAALTPMEQFRQDKWW